ncbi:MAG TPA: BamA/TamA family outer membrane protein [Vicinamibacterales bacterium]|nr:BamA/TamA family outer membrane protein [Vicinamibacterales bacterium]
MTFARALAFVLFAGALIPPTANAANRYDPRLRFRTISTARFDVHFHQGEEAQARRLAALAEEVARALDRTLGPPTGRVHVILVNQNDLPNGWATPIPNNVIEITAAAPGGESLIGHTDDWLRLAFTHEYTHAVHLSRAAGWIGGLRRVFGRMPLLFPNVFAPLWQIEGIATFEESAVTGYGRIHAGDFRMIAGEATASSMFLSIDRASGGLLDWPSGHAPYVYGGLFHEYLADRFGSQSLRELTDATAGRPPYLGAPAFRRVFKQALGELWKAFEDSMAQGAARHSVSTTARRLTRHGYTINGPRYASDGSVYYGLVGPHGFPSLMTLPIGGTEPRRVATRYLGSRIGFSGDQVVFDQLDVVRNAGLQSDLYAVGRENGEVRRLTHHARAADPDVSPDGRTIACTIQQDDGRALATMSVPPAGRLGSPSVVAGDAGTLWTSPRWSPDGTWIAAERRTVGGPSEIVLINPITRATRTLASSHTGRNVSPAWTPDGRSVIFASSDRTSFHIRSVDLETGALARLADTGPHASSPDVSPDGTSLVYVGYTADGYDLFSIPLASAIWTPVTPDAPGADPRTAAAASAEPARPYTPWSTMVPRFWVPTVESDADELVIGAATAGYDALGRHAFGVEAGWNVSRLRPDWQAVYAYDRWWPTLLADVSDDTDPWRGGEMRTREANVGALFPIRRVRWAQAVLAGVHASRDSFDCNGCPSGRDLRATRGALRAGWQLDAARAYAYSISDAEGWSASTTIEWSREALGSDGNGGAATADLRGYLSFGPAHAVLAARVAAASSWGDEPIRRLFTASGHGPQGRGFTFGSDAIGLLRGVDEGDLLGEQAAVANLDYRFPLRRIDRGLGTLPVFARTIHAAVFADAGHAWTGRFRGDDISRSVGAELSLDAVIGHAVPLTFTGGIAWRRTPAETNGLVLFGRIGRAF